ncbi:MAG: outer membrane beta-barrel protein [Sphingobacteriales bacterium]|nr:outer membrane beta-barrel protein [Sphingobacteriales bacterium]MBI3718925.1 outer membrane beta-barrel protein [Sphingobacteriales bacterium]
MRSLKVVLITISVFVQIIANQNKATAQNMYSGMRHDGEFGIALGAAHYFGDINTRGKINRPKIAFGAFYRKQFGDYVAGRLSATFAQVGYSDVYSKNEFQRLRNLSFNSNIFEVALQGDFNFFKFNPIDPDYRFTPYVTLGVGVFGFNPYTYLGGKKYYLQPLGTEGQGTTAYPDRKKYSLTALSFPLGVGIKYSITDQMNIGFEITHRFTTTDYLDDVSKTYAGAQVFKDPIAQKLQDRSYEFGTPIGAAGRQRGFSGQKDQYVTAMISITFNLSSYSCPSAR